MCKVPNNQPSHIDKFANLPVIEKSIYITGPMRTISNENFPAFNAAAKRWRDAGWIVFNPAESEDGLHLSETPNRTIHDCMNRDYIAVCRSTAIALLPYWWQSTGSVSEVFTALNSGKEIYDAESMLPQDRNTVFITCMLHISPVDVAGTKKRANPITPLIMIPAPTTSTSNGMSSDDKIDQVTGCDVDLFGSGIKDNHNSLKGVGKRTVSPKSSDVEVSECLTKAFQDAASICKNLDEDKFKFENETPYISDKPTHIEYCDHPHLLCPKIINLGLGLRPKSAVRKADPTLTVGTSTFQATLQSGDDIAQEASRLVCGDRNKAYGEPLDDFSRTAKIWSAILNMEVTAEQVALCMVGVKISREVNSPKRDNRVDGVGYWLTLERVIEERQRRTQDVSNDQVEAVNL